MSSRVKRTVFGILLGVVVLAYVFYNYKFQFTTDVELVHVKTTPLHQAIRDDLPLSTIKKMIDDDPKLLEMNDPALLGSISNYAVGRSRHDVLKMLIEDYGIDMTLGDTGTLDRSPLLLSVRSGDAKSVKIIVDSGVGDPLRLTAEGKDILDIVSPWHKDAVVKILQESDSSEKIIEDE